MVTLRAPDGASDDFQHAVDLFNRDLDGILAGLDPKQQPGRTAAGSRYRVE
jgi:hypothetical protein